MVAVVFKFRSSGLHSKLLYPLNHRAGLVRGSLLRYLGIIWYQTKLTWNIMFLRWSIIKLRASHLMQQVLHPFSYLLWTYHYLFYCCCCFFTFIENNYFSALSILILYNSSNGKAIIKSDGWLSQSSTKMYIWNVGYALFNKQIYVIAKDSIALPTMAQILHSLVNWGSQSIYMTKCDN